MENCGRYRSAGIRGPKDQGTATKLKSGRLIDEIDPSKIGRMPIDLEEI